MITPHISFQEIDMCHRKMAANKRRKLEGVSSPAPAPLIMSAFAARQKLWGMSSAPTSPEKTPAVLSEDDAGASEAASPRPTPTLRKGGKRGQPKAEVGSPRPPQTPVAASSPGRPEAREKTTLQHSTFNPTKRNYQRKSDGRVRLVASEGERLVILGSYGIKISEGELTMAGAILSASDVIHWVHAPYCHALPVLRMTCNTVMELHPHPAAPGLRQLAKLNPAFGKLWNEPETTSDKANRAATFQIIYTSDDGPKRALLQELISPPEWNKKLAGLVASKKKPAPAIFLCGPKSSGKSTFGRLLANRLVTDKGQTKSKSWSSVVVLDLDPGQPEFGPPGVISLNKISAPILSPPFCHAALNPTTSQLRAHAIASVTPALDPVHFIECVLDLFAHYQKSDDNAKHPLIINTPGWIQGTGLDILAELVRRMRPTEIVYMSQDGPEETVDSLRAAVLPGNNTAFHTLPSQTGDKMSARTSLHLRTMQAMSYFHLNWRSLAAPHQTWDPTPLTEVRPWRVRYTGAVRDRGFVGVLCYDHQPAPDLLTEAINGTILALVKVEDKKAFRDLIGRDGSGKKKKNGPEGEEEEGGGDFDTANNGAGGGITQTLEGIPLIQNPQGRTLDPRYSRALGLVLIRGVDTKRGELQLLTPLPGDVITSQLAAKKGNSSSGDNNLVLVAGKFDTPSWAYAEDLHRRTLDPASVASAAAATGGSGKGGGGGDENDEDEDENGQEIVRAVGGRGGAVGGGGEQTDLPWVEMLHGSQKRSVGSRVWRVRRDLGRN
ncbi:hypothetical protein B0T17DRAFT_608250 [Bombardia bombarda]|uniref:Polynucleotide 5'-hydroxyl-kinase GRC3 n=1 Tax=Bombardia bombarda TaxID=252184 RepID=A0AA40C5R9_9PEZI|nr:hypothetical protein B0T17DRAFT_608250 [Bombardia bombarda]